MALNKYKKKIVSKLRILISGRLHSSFYQTLLTSLSFYKDSFAMYETIIFLMICLWPKSNAPVGSKDECDFFRRAQFFPIPLFCLPVNPFSSQLVGSVEVDWSCTKDLLCILGYDKLSGL